MSDFRKTFFTFRGSSMIQNGLWYTDNQRIWRSDDKGQTFSLIHTYQYTNAAGRGFGIGNFGMSSWSLNTVLQSAYSDDGINFIESSTSGLGTGQTYGAVGSSSSVINRENKFLYTTDGTTWAQSASPETVSFFLYGPCFVGGSFYALNYISASVTSVWKSSDGGSTFEKISEIPGRATQIQHNGTYFVAWFTNEAYYSLDAVEWSACTVPSNAGLGIFGTKFNGRMIMRTSSANTYSYTDDGIEFLLGSAPTATTTTAIASDDDSVYSFVLNGSYYDLYKSPTGYSDWSLTGYRASSATAGTPRGFIGVI